MGFGEIFEEVNRRRAVTTRNPQGTVRNALSQGRQLVGLGDGRYGYLPHLLAGSRLRVSLTEKKPAHHPLIYSTEVRHALWPDFFEIQKRSVRRPVHLRLPTGDSIELPLTFLGRGVWGSFMPEELRRDLVENRAAAGDSLVVRVDDVEAGLGEAWFEPRRKRDEPAVARRNQELADAVERTLRRHRDRTLFITQLVVALLARGLYAPPVPPDPLETVLGADPRFMEAAQ